MRRAQVVMLAALLALGGGACGGGDEGDEAALESFEFGVEKVPVRSPVTVGYLAADDVESAGAMAAVEHANRYLNGVGGHPLELEVCVAGAAESSVQACLDRFVTAKVPGVLIGASAHAALVATRLDAADVTQFWHTAVDQAVFVAADSFVLTNGLALVFGAPAAYARSKRYTRAVEVVVDDPATVGPARSTGVPFYRNAGVELTVVPVPVGVTDMASILQATIATAPPLVHVTGNDVFCVGAVRSLAALGYEGDIVVLPQCLTPVFVDGVGEAVEGLRVALAMSQDPSDTEVALARAVLHRHAPDIDADRATATTGYATVMALVRATAAGITGDVTAASLASSIRTMAPSTAPMASGLSFRCGGTAVSFNAAICGLGAFIAELDDAGVPRSFVGFDTSGISTVPG